MAGGDGSQAIVAAIAAELGLPYACIPAGTRNHFALDLGVDRDDVVGALMRSSTAVSGGSTSATSTGGCSSTTSRSGSTPRRCSRATATRRSARCWTLCPTSSARPATSLDLRWRGPGGHEHRGGCRASVQQRLPVGRALGSGTRPKIDDGLLGITVIGAISLGRTRKAARCSARGAHGPQPHSRSVRRSRSPPVLTARPRPRCAAKVPHQAQVLGCAWPGSTRAPRPRRWLPRESARLWSSWCESPSAGTRNRRKDQH